MIGKRQKYYYVIKEICEYIYAGKIRHESIYDGAVCRSMKDARNHIRRFKEFGSNYEIIQYAISKTFKVRN